METETTTMYNPSSILNPQYGTDRLLANLFAFLIKLISFFDNAIKSFK